VPLELQDAIETQIYVCEFAGKQELELKLGAVHLVCEYVDVVMWFLSVCLLPEHPGLDYLIVNIVLLTVTCLYSNLSIRMTLQLWRKLSIFAGVSEYLFNGMFSEFSLDHRELTQKKLFGLLQCMFITPHSVVYHPANTVKAHIHPHLPPLGYI